MLVLVKGTLPNGEVFLDSLHEEYDFLPGRGKYRFDHLETFLFLFLFLFQSHLIQSNFLNFKNKNLMK